MNPFTQKFPLVETIVEVELRFLSVKHGLSERRTSHEKRQEVLGLESNTRRSLWSLSLAELKLKLEMVRKDKGVIIF